MEKILKLLLTVFLIFIVLVVGVWAYFKYFKLAYSDSQYGFIIKDQKGWYSVPPREGVYYSLGTAENDGGLVISYFGVSPVVKVAPTNKEEDYETFKESCGENFEEYGKSNLSSSEITINNLEGFVCSFEGIQEHVPGMYIMKQYFILNEEGKSYDYTISVAYPKNNPEEEEKVERIVNSFHAK